MPNRKITNTARQKGRQLLRRLRPRFPALFPADLGDLKPWAVGEGYRLRQVWAGAEDGETVSAQVWYAATHLWFHGDLKRRVAYLKCLTQGAPRYDRHGNVAGEVSVEEAEHAAAELAKCEEQSARLIASQRTRAKAGTPETEEPPIPAQGRGRRRATRPKPGVARHQGAPVHPGAAPQALPSSPVCDSRETGARRDARLSCRGMRGACAATPRSHDRSFQKMCV